MEMETVWHGGLWREVPPPPPATPVEVCHPVWTRPTGVSKIQQLLAVIGTDWTERQTILEQAGASNGRHTSALLSRLYERGLVERQEVRLHRRGRPSFLYRRRQ